MTFAPSNTAPTAIMTGMPEPIAGAGAGFATAHFGFVNDWHLPGFACAADARPARRQSEVKIILILVASKRPRTLRA
jgi:hypothetical protein